MVLDWVTTKKWPRPLRWALGPPTTKIRHCSVILTIRITSSLCKACSNLVFAEHIILMPTLHRVQRDTKLFVFSIIQFTHWSVKEATKNLSCFTSHWAKTWKGSEDWFDFLLQDVSFFSLLTVILYTTEKFVYLHVLLSWANGTVEVRFSLIQKPSFASEDQNAFSISISNTNAIYSELQRYYWDNQNWAHRCTTTAHAA